MLQIRKATKHVSIGLLGSMAVFAAGTMLTRLAIAQMAPATPPSISTPDKVDSRIGTLEFTHRSRISRR